MIHFIYGSQITRIRKKVDKLVKEFLSSCGIDEFNYIKLNADTTLVQDAIDECSYFSLGSDKKAVYLENCKFLTSGRQKKRSKAEGEHDFDKLIKYIQNPNPDTLFIMSVESSDLNKSNEVYKALNKSNEVEIEELKEMNEQDWKTNIKLAFNKQGVSIDSLAIDELVLRVGNDVPSMFNNINKLSLYTDHVRLQDVQLMVAAPLEDKTYNIFEYLIKGENAEAVGLFRELSKNNVEAVTIISGLATQFLRLSRIYYLNKSGHSKEEIAEIEKIKPGKAYYLINDAKMMSEKSIHQTLENLYQADYQIKSGQFDRFNVVELFLLNFRTK